MRVEGRTSGWLGERGAAVVEFAIVSGVMVLLLMWSHFFFDIIQIRMKNLEAARTALWEFTAYPLSDYAHGKQSDHNKFYDDAKDEIEKDIKELYEKDLDSALKYKRTSRATKRLTIDNLTVDEVRTSNRSSWAGSLIGLLTKLPGLTSFNKNGYVSAEMKADFKSTWVPTQFTFGKSFKVTPLKKNLKQKFFMVVDSWKLEDGCSVEIPGGYKSGGGGPCATKKDTALMTTQTERVAFAGAKKGFQLPKLNTPDLGDTDPFAVRLASVNFGSSYGAAAEDGRQHLEVSKGVADFYTAPFCNESRGGSTGCQGEYQKAADQRGQGFLGCPKEQYDGKELCPWDQNQGP